MGGGSFFAVNNAASAAASSTAAVGAWGMAGRAVISSVISQGIGVATGLQSKFSWTNVAAAGIGAGVGSAVGAQVFPNASDFSERLTRGFVAGAAGGVAASVLSGGKANYLQIATDAFGNALGNSVVDELRLRGPSQPQPSSTSAISDERTREIFRQQTMGDIQRLAAQDGGRGMGQGPVSLDETAFNDIGSLRELGRGPKGEIYWNNDVTSYPVADRRMIPAVPLAPLLPQRPADSIREIGPLEGFFTFNKFGRFLSSAGTTAKALPGALLHSAQQAGYASADVTGYAVGQLHEWAGDSSYRVRPQSNFFMQAQEEGLGLTTAKYGLEMVDSMVARPLRAIVNRNPEQMGEIAAELALGGVAGKLVKGGVGVAGDAIVGGRRLLGEAIVEGAERVLSQQGLILRAMPEGSARSAAIAGVEFSSSNRLVPPPYSGNVYAADFVGPVDWKYFYRGDSAPRSTFLSSMAQEQGATNSRLSFLERESTGRLDELFDTHGNIGSQGLPTIGVSTDPLVAEYFARGPKGNQAGYVTEFRMQRHDFENLARRNYENRHDVFDVNHNIGRPEQEFLFNTEIPKNSIHRGWFVR